MAEMREDEEVAEMQDDEVELFTELKRQVPDFAAAVVQLYYVIKDSKVTDLDAQAHLLRESVKEMNLTSISVVAGLDNLVRYMTRKEGIACTERRSSTSEELQVVLYYDDFNLKSIKLLLRERMKQFSVLTTWAYGTIAMLAEAMMKTRCPRKAILVHGSSRIVLEVLRHIHIHSTYKVFCTFGSPSQNGLIFCGRLQEHDIFPQMLSDTAVAYYLSDVDIVLVGANGVNENGGIISQIGTLQIATLAHANSVPVLAVAESFKFGASIPKKVAVEDGTPEYDYTPPMFLTHIISDSGVFSPCQIEATLKRLYTSVFPFW